MSKNLQYKIVTEIGPAGLKLSYDTARKCLLFDYIEEPYKLREKHIGHDVFSFNVSFRQMFLTRYVRDALKIIRSLYIECPFLLFDLTTFKMF
jgi:hypothetical protein